MTRTNSDSCVRNTATIAAVFALAAFTLVTVKAAPRNSTVSPKPDAAASREAFLQVYKVFTSPRCLNCHPSGDVPLQGDDSHPHLQNVKRGEDGRGKYALKCASCHQDVNLPGENMPPGNPTWQLPRKAMPLVFQGKSPRQLA